MRELSADELELVAGGTDPTADETTIAGMFDPTVGYTYMDNVSIILTDGKTFVDTDENGWYDHVEWTSETGDRWVWDNEEDRWRPGDGDGHTPPTVPDN